MSTQVGTTTIRRVQIQDIPVVKELILQMLTDSPQAFGETLTEAQARTAEDWHHYVEQTTLPHQSAFISIDDHGACGFVSGDSANPQTPPGTVVVSRLWVAPRKRGIGLGRQLMDVVTAWARAQGAQLIGLGVTEMNVAAMKFYENLGYADTGIRAPLPWDATKQIIILGRRL